MNNAEMIIDVNCDFCFKLVLLTDACRGQPCKNKCCPILCSICALKYKPELQCDMCDRFYKNPR